MLSCLNSTHRPENIDRELSTIFLFHRLRNKFVAYTGFIDGINQALLIKVHKLLYQNIKLKTGVSGRGPLQRAIRRSISLLLNQPYGHIVATSWCCCLLHMFVSASCRHHTPFLVAPALYTVQLFCCGLHRLRSHMLCLKKLA